MTRIEAELGKWLQTVQISWSQRMAYKLSFVLLVIGPTLVFFFVKYSLWTSVYAARGVDRIAGYDLSTMLTYQVWVMVVAFLGQGYNGINVSEDIRLGRISSYLVYPFDFWKFHAASFLSLQILQLLVSAVTVAAMALFGVIRLPPLATLAAGTAMSLLVSLFWFVVIYTIGVAGFWLEETWVLRVMLMTVSSFLSGAVLPLELFPAALRRLLAFTPFPCVTFVPTKVFMGSYDGSLAAAAGLLLCWIAIGAVLAAAIWRRGLRLYTAAGM
ncbi:MAG: ABC-2 family transporter protein [Acidobacteriota bacterium]